MNGLNGLLSLSRGLSRRSSSPTGSAAKRRTTRRELHAEWLERRLALAATPTASLSAPDGFIGTEIPLSVTFDNTGTDIGYGPFIDVIMPASGNAPPLPNNGVSFKTGSATYLGTAVPTTVLTFGPTGQVNHPFAKTALGNPVVISGDPGDQLVVFQLPFGSYGPAQPPATVSFNGIISSGAQPGSDYNVTATGGFQYQVDGSGNPTVDQADFGATTTDPVEAQLFTIAKTSSAPGGETATGPNFTRTYTVTVSVAPGQTLSSFTLTDVLPNNVQFVSVDSVTANGDPTPTQTSVPSTTVPGGTLSYLFDPVNGTGGNDISLIYSFFMPEYTAGGADVIPLETGGTSTATNSAGGSATWQNTNPNFPPTQFVVGTPATTTVTGKTLALQKSASPSSNAKAGDTITYTLSFQVSDYFALTDFTIDDLLTDGQDFDTSFTPTLAFTQKGETLAAQAIDAANYVVNDTFANGTTTVDFDVSAELLRRGLTTGRNLVGAGIDNTGTGGPDPDPLPGTPGTTGTITFRTVVRNTYRATGDEVVQGDVVGNTAAADSTVLNFTNLTPTTSTFSDGSAASVTLASGDLQKAVHAVNGAVVTGVPVVKPGDTVTFRLTYNLPFSSIGQYTLTDFLPLPIFIASNLTFDSSGNPFPGTGQWQFGPLDTFSQPDPPGVGGPVPTTSFNAAANSVSWNFGTFQDDEDRDGVTDIFFTVTATDRPFIDGLLLTNQGVQTEVTTQGETLSKTAIAQVQIIEPLLGITKGVVATNDAGGVFTPTPSAPAGVTFSAPGSSPSFTGTVTSNGLATTPIVAALTGVGANDLVTFAIVIENTGRSPNGAFDVTFRDTFDATKFQIPTGGLNLQVRDGAGTLLPFTTVGTGLFDATGGILLDDGVTTGSLGPGKTTGGTVINTGTNIAIITYDLQLKPNVQPSDVATNTATLSNYAAQEGGPNFIPDGLEDSTTVTVAAPTVVKTLVSTSIVNANNSNTQAVIGELATYTITVTVPQGTMPTAQVIDTMPGGLAYV
ncbi:MAG: beta strand repeat-containing protein, partial [Planctomycetia bacterium]